jgi:hypothetical protein
MDRVRCDDRSCTVITSAQRGSTVDAATIG